MFGFDNFNNFNKHLEELQYFYIPFVEKEVKDVLKEYNHIQYSIEEFRVKELAKPDRLICLNAIVPMVFNNNSFNIPCKIYLQKVHPIDEPLCFVTPGDNMYVPENHSGVNQNGRIRIEWQYMHNNKNISSNLSKLVKTMSESFSREPPLFQRRESQNFHQEVSEKEKLFALKEELKARIIRKLQNSRISQKLIIEQHDFNKLQEKNKGQERLLKRLKERIQSIEKTRNSTMMNIRRSKEYMDKFVGFDVFNDAIKIKNIFREKLVELEAESNVCDDLFYILELQVMNNDNFPIDRWKKMVLQVSRLQFEKKFFIKRIEKKLEEMKRFQEE